MESSRVEVSLVVIVEYSCYGGVESSFDSGGMEFRWYRVQLLVIVKMSPVESSCYSRV